jgi:hypothetical protein
VDRGTLFTYQIDMRVVARESFGMLGDPLVERAETRAMRTNLRNLTELLESGD